MMAGEHQFSSPSRDNDRNNRNDDNTSNRQDQAAAEEGEDGEVYEPRKPRRRFRGLHWRHASQTYTPPSPSHQTRSSSNNNNSSSSISQVSPPRLRPLSVGHGSSGFEVSGESPTSSIGHSYPANPKTPPSGGSYSY